MEDHKTDDTSVHEYTGHLWLGYCLVQQELRRSHHTSRVNVPIALLAV